MQSWMMETGEISCNAVMRCYSTVASSAKADYSMTWLKDSVQYSRPGTGYWDYL